MSRPVVAEVFSVGVGGPIIARGTSCPALWPGVSAPKASQYFCSDGTCWSKAGDGDLDWVKSVGFIGFENADTVTIDAGMPVVVFGEDAKRASAASFALAPVIGVVIQGAAPTLYIVVDPYGELALTTAQWDAVTGQSGGLTPSAIYYLGLAPGTLTTTPPSSSGQLVCQVGRAMSATSLFVSPQVPIYL